MIGPKVNQWRSAIYILSGLWLLIYLLYHLRTLLVLTHDNLLIVPAKSSPISRRRLSLCKALAIPRLLDRSSTFVLIALSHFFEVLYIALQVVAAGLVARGGTAIYACH